MSKLRFSFCRQCKRPIVWAEVKATNSMVPLDPIPDQARGRFLFDSQLRTAIKLDAPLLERAILRQQPLFIDHRTECQTMTRQAAMYEQSITEDQLGELIRDACIHLGWHFLWYRKTFHSSAGILDLMLIPIKDHARRSILHRELKGYRGNNGNLGAVTVDQAVTIEAIQKAGGDAGLWTPADWQSGKILDELA